VGIISYERIAVPRGIAGSEMPHCVSAYSLSACFAVAAHIQLIRNIVGNLAGEVKPLIRPKLSLEAGHLSE
jgi:hypothetical protein